MHVLTTLALHHTEHELLLRERERSRRAATPVRSRRSSGRARDRYAALLPWAGSSPRG